MGVEILLARHFRSSGRGVMECNQVMLEILDNINFFTFLTNVFFSVSIMVLASFGISILILTIRQCRRRDEGGE